MLKHVDVFSGIGGFTLALKDVSETKMYCDISPTSQQILRNLMRKGKIPTAPIVNDVKDLSKALTFKFDIMTAGFPCFPAGTPVLTATGFKAIEEVTLADELMTDRARYRPITNMQRKIYSGDMVSFRCRYSPHEIVCTENHPLFAKLPGSDPMWIPASTLTVEHLIGVPVNSQSQSPRFIFERRCNRETSKEIEFNITSPDDWFTIGYFMGDGWVQNTRKADGRLQYRVSFVIADHQVHDILPRLLKSMHLTVSRGGDGACTKYVCHNIKWWTVLSTLGKYAHGKTIPQWVEDAPIGSLQAFLDGYGAADGSCRYKNNNDHERLATVSMDLAYGMQRVLMKLGHIASVQYTARAPTTVINGRTVSQRGSYNLEWVPQPKRRCVSHCRDGYGWLKVARLSSAEVHDVPVYNFEVEEDHSYVVRNLAVHNCTGLSECGKREGLANVETALVSHLVSLARKHRPPLIMLENVPPITEPGVLKAVLAPFERMGYRIRWTLVPAYAVGLPHKRMRWFCAAFRSLPLLKRVAAGMKQHHRQEPPRCTREKDPTFNKRFPTLGYTVVPACIVVAFKHLAAAATDGRVEFPLPPAPDLGLTIRQGPLVFRKPMWPTPRTTPGSSKTLTARVAKDLPTTVRFEAKSTSQFMNIDWATWLMGYPRGWTEL